MKVKQFIVFVCFIIFFVSCSNNEEDELRSKMSSIHENIRIRKTIRNAATLEQYKDYEYKLNKAYVDQLRQLIDNEFDAQLEEFEDNELGLISGYRYMFKDLVNNDEEWEDLQKQLGDRYFGPQVIMQKVYELSNRHENDIKNLRLQFYKKKSGVKEPKIALLDIPKSEVYLGELRSHSGRNLVIEIGTELLGWMIGCIIAGIITGSLLGDPGCIGSIISIVLVLVVSYFVTLYNDNKLLNSIKEQKKEIVIDYSGIKDSLDKNTAHFYDTYR